MVMILRMKVSFSVMLGRGLIWVRVDHLLELLRTRTRQSNEQGLCFF